MKRIRKWLIGIGIVLLVLVIVLAGVGMWYVRRPWPQVSGTIKVAGLLAPVEVMRDEWGVPHIYADNEHDLFFAQGYVHAQDRLWQMEMNRRLGSGTLSEVLGRSTVNIDRWFRRFGLRGVAEQSWEELDDDSRAILEAYAEGVNAYIESHRDRLPLEFTILGSDPEPWTPVDTLTWANLLAHKLAIQRREEIAYAETVALVGEGAARQLTTPYDKNTPIIVSSEAVSYDWERHSSFNAPIGIPSEVGSYDWLRDSSFEQGLADPNGWLSDPRPGLGSNSWVVHGNRTATGKPVLANDTHLDMTMPSMWYENGLHGGRFDSVGFALPGAPLVLIGHNQHIAWGITVLRADDQDFYIEKLNDLENPTQYEFMGKWRDLEFTQETIEVKGHDPVTLEIPFTHHGPIMKNVSETIKDDVSEAIDEDVSESSNEKPLALRWTFHEGNATFKSVVLLNLAANWDEFRAALQYWDAPAHSFVYADVEGNIGYQAAGALPIRVPGHNGRLPVPGWTGKYEWQGFIPFDELPVAFNPSIGFIATSNNKVVSDDYPYVISGMWNPGYRARRIIDLLSAGDDFTIESMQDIQGDTYSLPAQALRPYLLAIESEDGLQAEALSRVKAWDLYNEPDRVGASIYQVWYAFMVQNTVCDELGGTPPLALWLFVRPPWLIELMADADNAWFDDDRTAEVETRDDIVRRSLADAVDWLSKEYGENPDKWEWGRLHTMTFIHAPFGRSGIFYLERLFNSKTVPARGGSQTVNMSEHFYERKQQFDVELGTAQRMVVDVSDWDSMSVINTTGQSGHLFHPYREDQISLWQNVEYRPMLFSREAVEENAKNVLELTPLQ